MANDEQRISRLVGDGEGGGGIPLPPVFGAILEYLADDKAATSGELSKIVSSALEYKKERVFTTWRNWKSVTADFLAQLEAQGFITQPEAGFYRRTEKVKPGAELVIIPEAKIPGTREKGISLTIYTDAQRRVLDKISEVKSEAAREGVGSRDMDRYLEEIVNTVDKKRSRRDFHAGSISPLEDEHGSFRMCTECLDDFELTNEYFSSYRSRTEYYWNRICSECRRKAEAGKKAELQRIHQVKRSMEMLINSGDPSLADVMARYGLDDYLARKYWDDLAALGKVPSRDRAWKK